jgi:hypothetical protein
MLVLDILLQLVGAFYMFAGIVLVRAVMMERMLGTATAALMGTPPTARDRVRAGYTLLLAVMTYLSGLGLMSLCDVAVFLFIATLLLQGAYLFWIAPRYLDTLDESHSPGRQRSTNACVVFGAATAIVMWASSFGRLQPMEETSPTSMAMTAALVAVFLAYTGWMYLRTRIGAPR